MNPFSRSLLLAAVFLVFAALGGAQLRGQENWSGVTTPTDRNLWSVCYGGGQFVAVGEGSAVVSSADGLAWVARSVPSLGYWLVAVGYGSGNWVIVGDRGLILTSNDLVTWSPRSSGTSSRINGVAYGGGRWMAVADSGELLTSTDAVVWSRLKPSSDRLRGIVYAYGQFVITGDNGLVRTTIDASDYAEKAVPGSNFLEAVTYARRTFVAIGEAGFAVGSTDGVNWDNLRTGSSAYLRGIAYFNNQFIAAGTEGVILTAADPTSVWTPRRSGSTALLTSVAASDAAAVAVGFGGTVLRSAPAASAPIIVTNPSNLTEVVGSNVLFQATASGSPPLTYQWLFNGQPITAATSDRLLLPGVNAEQAGYYSVRVSNALGSATSGSAALKLVESTEPGPIVDPTFFPKLLMPNGIAAAVEQPDGKIVIGGSQFFVTAGVSPFALARLNRDGSIDSSFAIGSGLNSGGSVWQLVQQPDGKLLVAGSFQSVNGISRANLARLNPDGSVDTAFIPAPAISVTPPMRISLQFGEKVIALMGRSIVRLNKDGSLDPSFSVGNGLSISGFAVFTDGSIAALASLGAGPLELRKLNSSGGFDEAVLPLPFALQGDPGGFPTLVSTDSGHVFLVYRSSYSSYGYTRYSSRFQQLDEVPLRFALSFNGFIEGQNIGMGSLFSGPPGAVYISQSIPAGYPNGSGRGVISRYRMTGALDTSFVTRSGANGPISSVIALRDGGLLVMGSFTTFDGVSRPNLVRLVGANALEATPPTLVSVSPEGAAVLPGTAVSMSALAAGTAPLSYQWTIRDRDGAGLVPASEAAKTNLRFVPSTPGVYTATLTATNRAGSVTSAPIRITVVDSAPFIADLPTSATVLSGRSATLTATVTGTQPIAYQWFKNGALVGSDSSLTITRASTASEGDYTLVATNGLGRTTSTPVRLSVDGSARLVNISTRTGISADRPLIAGFVITGAPGQRVLVRGVGPGLGAFGLSGGLPDPTISLFDAYGRVLASNDNFTSGPSAATLGGVVDGVGAFRLTSNLDSALVASLQPGAYTVQLADSTSRSGVGLVEVYRADDSTSRLVNLSSRGFVGTGSSLAIAGIAVEGERPRQFLVRGIGPGLRDFGVTDALSDPSINLTSSLGESLFRNDDWGNAANASELAVTASRLGAFPLAAGSRDAAMLVTLAPGNYTALVSGAGESSGIALVEVYEVP